MRLIPSPGSRGGHWSVLALLLFYTISVYTALGERIEFLDAIRHQLLLGVVLIALSVMVLLEDPVDLSESKPLLLGIVLLFIVELTQVPFASDPGYAKDTFIDYTLKEAMFTFFMVTIVRSPNRLRLLMATFLFSLAWVYQESVRGLITGHLVWYNQGIQRLHGAVDLYQHPNGLSLIAVTCLPFVIYLFGAVRSVLLRLVMLGIAAMACVCIIYTGSRAGYVGTIAIAFFWWLLSRHKVRGALLGLAVGTIVISVLPKQYIGRFESIGGEEAAGHSKDKRIQIMKDAWAIWKENPFGVGINGFILVREREFGRNQDTHNLYLQLLTHIGIQGTVIFLYFMIALYVAFHRAVARLERLRGTLAGLARAPDTDRRTRRLLARTYGDARYVTAVAQAGRLYLLMLAVNGIFAHTLYLICWWMASGLAICTSAMTGRMEEAGHEVVRRRLAAREAAEAAESGDASGPEAYAPPLSQARPNASA